MSKGERFSELAGLVVRKVFDPKQGQPQNGQPGKVRQGLILTDGSAEMGFTLWDTDVGQVMEGDLLTLKGGWVHGWEGSDGTEKFDLRLRKNGVWAKTGSGADIPQAPPPQAPKPSPQYVPVGGVQREQDGGFVQYVEPMPSPAAQAVLNEVGAREANINRQSARRDAVALLVATENRLPVDDVLAIARQLYRWAMNLGPHWMEDESTRKRFWAKLGEAGLDSKDAHRELAVYSMYDFEGTEADALSIILSTAPEAPRTPATTQTVVESMDDLGFATETPPGMPTELISTSGNFDTAGAMWMAVLANLKLNKSHALELVGVTDLVEVQGITLADKYQTIARAIAR